MYEGESSRFWVKPSYGYGSDGNKELGVPPNATLIYDIELIEFTKGKERFEMNLEEKIDLSLSLKDKGNAFFGAKKYKRALKSYDKAMGLFQYTDNLNEEQKEKVDKMKAACCGNIASCHIKTQEWEVVVAQCTKALDFDPNYSKCYYNRGVAYAQMGENELAVKNFESGLKTTPLPSESLKKNIEKYLISVKKRISKLKAKEKKLYENMFSRVSLTDEEKAKKKEGTDE